MDGRVTLGTRSGASLEGRFGWDLLAIDYDIYLNCMFAFLCLFVRCAFNCRRIR